MKIELKPCPFCGGKAELVEDVYRDGLYYWVECMECGNHTHAAGEFGLFKKKKETVEAWNRRTEFED